MLYGNPPMYEHLKWPETNKVLEYDQGSHWVLLGYFDHCKIPIITHIVHMIKTGELDFDYFDFAYSLLDVGYR